MYKQDLETKKNNDVFDESAETTRSRVPEKIMLAGDSVYVDENGLEHI